MNSVVEKLFHKQEEEMRKYEEKKENQVVEVYCNCCGKKLAVKDGVIMEGVLPDGFLGIFFRERWGMPQL